METVKSTKMDVAIVLLCVAIFFEVLCGITMRRGTAAQTTPAPVMLIDAGHGGEDGGAEGADGTLEKHLNLAIAGALGDMLQVMGYTVTYTRTEDTMVNAEGDTLRARKVSDMRNRLSMIEAADMTVSIHQNKFPQTQYSGTQVFYGTASPESQPLAAAIRESVLTLLQPNNTRELKKGDSSVYLLKNATKPIVLVECGFLSNVAEREQLKTREYRQRLAFAIAGGVMGYTLGG